MARRGRGGEGVPDPPPSSPYKPVCRRLPAALRTACSCITMYADARDGALRWSERLNRHGPPPLPGTDAHREIGEINRW